MTGARAERAMTDGVDASVQRNETAAAEPVTDLPPGRAECAQLLARHDASLRRGDTTDRAVQRIFVPSAHFAGADVTNGTV